ncbi:50S ribosomal protein L22 [Leptospira santarosai]|uniref:Large ribosomal subunit protein uL22 n=2 Tax=Leptospira santarosai TaxID=28183 RepID=K8YEX7_9LEPT|nr:50S ribosomal protein L22 [Leptospira santarosai]EKT88832.1 50S ribosomal protein L22 [Leptospira santarosai serovar Shermani str. LT 821]EMM76929.1 ribosomal protein L22 [Leptospira santarosai str. 2000030832]EMN22586.1 ribosomal protein L22 [Leptospira santarosai serovar Arenal str. MAVJ 401]EMO85637.1 ribosomal protein L22 [Leptospira santarosai str. AIM]EPG82004.1 ribosomal protein L22 [Leptospira santarosai serovar Shermani str. 1342KT]
MEAKAVARFVRMSPRKVRLVADEIRGYAVNEALDILKFTNKRAIEPLTKVILSASANASVLNNKVDLDELFIKKIYVDEGPIMKRFRPRARGRAARIRKRLSHITVVLSD